jgi:hypothetical protein
MSYTRLQLANRALEKLTVVGTGQSPEAEDTAKINAIIPAMSAFLESTVPPIYSIADLAEIDDAAFEWLAEYLAYMGATDFGKPMDEAQRQRAEFMLRLITSSGPSYQVMTAEYF